MKPRECRASFSLSILPDLRPFKIGGKELLHHGCLKEEWQCLKGSAWTSTNPTKFCRHRTFLELEPIRAFCFFPKTPASVTIPPIGVRPFAFLHTDNSLSAKRSPIKRCRIDNVMSASERVGSVSGLHPERAREPKIHSDRLLAR